MDNVDNVIMEQELMLSLELIKSSHTKHEQKKRHKDKSQVLREEPLYESIYRWIYIRAYLQFNYKYLTISS